MARNNRKILCHDELSKEAEPQQTVANRIVRSKDGEHFAFSEGFALIHPKLHAASVSICGNERHDIGDFENNSISVGLPSEFCNVSVAVMYSEVLWQAGGSTYAKKQSDYVSLNHVRTKVLVHYEKSEGTHQGRRKLNHIWQGRIRQLFHSRSQRCETGQR